MRSGWLRWSDNGFLFDGKPLMLATRSVGPYRLPDFSAINPSQWDAAIAQALEQAETGIALAAADSSVPNFANTFLVLERLDRDLSEVTDPFFASNDAHATDAGDELAGVWSARLAQFNMDFYQNAALFARCRAASEAWPDAPEPERRLMDEHLRRFARSGLGLPEAERLRMREMAAETAHLCEAFKVACRGASAAMLVLPETAAAGLDPEEAQAARTRAAEAGQQGLAFALDPDHVAGWLATMSDRSSREALWTACADRGSGIRDEDTLPIVRRILELRSARARFLGYDCPAQHLMADTMAQGPDAALKLLMGMWEKVRTGLGPALGALKELAAADGIADLAPWDLPYYAEQYRRVNFDLDAATVRAHLPLHAVRAGAFALAYQLFGVTFVPVEGELYHPDAQAYLVADERAGGAPLGLLVIDDLARPGKASGAWMSNLRAPSFLENEPREPWVLNVCSFAPGANGGPPLLGFDEALTVFHELGHALHALLSTARYPSQAGTNVAQDFVELPSQVPENWPKNPAFLQRLARHWQTGEPLAEECIDRLLASERFGQIFRQSSYLISAYLDLVLHSDERPHLVDVDSFERSSMAMLEVPAGVAPRHRHRHFAHLYADEDYAARYYCYLWAEALEADVFTRFQAPSAMGIAELGQRLRECVFAPGGSRDPAALFEDFMGRELSDEALGRRYGEPFAPLNRSPKHAPLPPRKSGPRPA